MTYPPHPDQVLREGAVRWTCKQCGSSGELQAEPERRAARMMDEVENAHAEVAAWCPYYRYGFTLEMAS